MSERIAQLLEQLAKKLGVTIDHLWQVMVSQARVSVAITIVTIAFMILVSSALSYFAVRLYKKDEAEEDDISVSTGLFTMLAGLCLLVTIIGMACSIQNVITAIYNPEYWALQEILSSLRNI